MDYKLEDIIDIPLLQNLQDKLNLLYSFPSAILNNEGKVLTAVAWQDICTKFHRLNPECEKECIKSDHYILEHIREANPAVSYQCPHGLVDNATPIIIDGKHLGNFFTGQFFLEKPDLDFFRKQAKKYGFVEKDYLEAVEKVPVWTKEKLEKYLDFIKGFIELIAGIGLKNIKEIESRKALIESEERHQAIIKSTSDWVWEIDEQGKYSYCSDSVGRILGYSAEEIIGKTPFDLMPLEESERVLAIFRDIVTTKSSIVDIENWNIHKDGHRVCLLTNGFPIFNETGKLTGYRGVDKDITERKLAEQEVALLAHAVKSTSECISITDMDNNILFVNQAFLNKYGYDEDELFGQNISIVSSPNNPPGILKEIYTETMQGGWQGETLNRKKDGTEFFISLSTSRIQNQYGNSVSLIGIAKDITERKHAESTLRQSEEKFRLLADHMTDMVWLMDLNLEITYISPSVEKQRGFTFEELQQMPLDKNLTPASTQLAMGIFSRELPKMMSDPTYSFPENVDLEFNRKDGTTFWLECLFSIIRDGNGVPVSVLGVGRDITEHRLLMKQLIESEERLSLFFSQSLVGFFFMMLDEPITWNDSIDKEKALDYAFDHQRVIKANKAILEQYGVTEEQFMGFTPNDFFAHDIKQGRLIWKDLFDNGYQHTDTEERKFNGTVMIIEGDYICIYDSQHRINGSFGIQREVTEGRQADENLRKSRNELEAYFENDISANYLASLEGEILSCNKTFMELFGFKDKAHVEKSNFTQLYKHPSDRNVLLSKLMEFGKFENEEVEFLSLEGKTINAIINTIGISNDAGELINTRGYMVDITVRKNAEEKIHQQLEELRRWQEVTLGREDRNRQLKQEVNELLIRMGEKIRYPSQENANSQAVST